MKYLITTMAGLALLTTAATYEGKVPAKGIAGPFPGTVETCTLDSNKAILRTSTEGETVIVANNGNGWAKYTLECEG